MTRVPISFYLNILAGIIVLFNHYAASETGDVALNKITGAASRFYAAFRDATLTLQHGYSSSLERALCSPVTGDVFPRDAVEHLKEHYCHSLALDDRRPPEGYGGSDFVFAYNQVPIRPIAPRMSAGGFPARSSFGLDESDQVHLLQAVWGRSREGIVMIGTFLLHTYASWWWFRAPLRMAGSLLGAYTALSVLEQLVGASVAVRCLTQAYVTVVVDLLRCMEWEAQRRALEVGIGAMERVYDFVSCVR